jgi:hypothetical protein
MNDDTLTRVIDGATGRDNGKRYRAVEIDPLTMAGYMLRLTAALRSNDIDALMEDYRAAAAPEAADDVPVGLLMQTVQGCDPKAVHALLTDLLTHVEVAPDPKYPEAFRALMPTGDIREFSTLGKVLMAVMSLNLAGN